MRKKMPMAFGAEFGEFVLFCQDHWSYERDRSGEPCQDPHISYRRMKGDCDDFAVMIAYFAQERWGYDSKIYTIKYGGICHAVTGIAVGSKSVIDSYYRDCRHCVWFTSGEKKRLYLTIDMKRCPDYAGKEFKIVRTDEWYELVGRPI